MKYYYPIALLVCFSLIIQPLKSQTGKNSKIETIKPDSQKWVQIFNGKNLEGWTPKVAGAKVGENVLDVFRVENGVIKVSYEKYEKFNDRFGHLFYKDKLTSYILRLEYRFYGEMLSDAPSYCYRNSGIMIHSQSAESMDLDQKWPVSIEAQLLGSTDSVKQATGNVCTPGTTVYFQDKFTDEHCIRANSKNFYDHEWVKLEIVVHGNRVIHHIINGDTVLTYSKPQVGGFLVPDNYPFPTGTDLKEGYIALQAEGQPLEFRKIELLILPDEKN